MITSVDQRRLEEKLSGLEIISAIAIISVPAMA